ncbi:hypothetical protein SAMN05216304_103272 [Bosea sp. OK403]|jgi:hypothetical protein|uniref:hypothetical protein n=1 Tax=Bosea sp. OK403 TaxID=1855286 RepID=UPI0008EF3527|nr:hypothetical protein [Bosea sp. OK403]SFI71635.1 hypothetical protein SAMN05216304_103272 [Bosea sp. OK403]
MIARIDPIARGLVGRFVFKVSVSAVLALFGKSGFFLALSGLLALYGMITAVTAVMQGQRFTLHALNQWDEVLWLSIAAMGCSLLQQSPLLQQATP